MKALVTSLAIIGLAGNAVPSVAQTSFRLTGTVTDSAGAPIEGVGVGSPDAEIVAASRADGTFSLSLPTGDHLIEFSKDGWVRRQFRLTLQGDTRLVRDLGRVILSPLPPNSVLLTGRIADAETGDGLGSVAIELNDATIAITDTSGMFRSVVQADSVGNRLVLRRIGYEVQQFFFDVPEGKQDLDLEIQLTSDPIRLSDIAVTETGSTIASRRLADFQRRREQGLGHFFTGAEIEKMQPVVVSDVVRRVPGVTVVAASTPSDMGMGPRDVLLGLEPPGTYTKIQFQARGNPQRNQCQPEVYVDEVRLANPNIDVLTRPERLAGMEVYTNTSDIPPEYATLGSPCGVIVMWTKDGMADRRSPVTLGLHYGGRLLDGRFRQGRIGGQLIMKFFGPFQFNPGFNIIVNVPSASGSSSFSGWQMQLNVQTRPLGPASAWYVGGGATVMSLREKFDSDPLSIGRGRTPTNVFPGVVTGVAIPMGSLRPFVEVHVLNFFTPRDAHGLIYTGVHIPVGQN